MIFVLTREVNADPERAGHRHTNSFRVVKMYHDTMPIGELHEANLVLTWDEYGFGIVKDMYGNTSLEFVSLLALSFLTSSTGTSNAHSRF